MDYEKKYKKYKSKYLQLKDLKGGVPPSAPVSVYAAVLILQEDIDTSRKN